MLGLGPWSTTTHSQAALGHGPCRTMTLMLLLQQRQAQAPAGQQHCAPARTRRGAAAAAASGGGAVQVCMPARRRQCRLSQLVLWLSCSSWRCQGAGCLTKKGHATAPLRQVRVLTHRRLLRRTL